MAVPHECKTRLSCLPQNPAECPLTTYQKERPCLSAVVQMCLVPCMRVKPQAPQGSKGTLFSLQGPGLSRPPHKWLFLLLHGNPKALLHGRSLPGFSSPKRKARLFRHLKQILPFLIPRSGGSFFCKHLRGPFSRNGQKGITHSQHK